MKKNEHSAALMITALGLMYGIKLGPHENVRPINIATVSDRKKYFLVNAFFVCKCRLYGQVYVCFA